MPTRSPFALLLILGSIATAAPAEESTSGVDYLRDVKPILTRRCVACHGALTQKAKLRLDTAARLLAGGENGPAAEPGKAEDSLILTAVTGAEGWRMPPEGEGEPLTSAEIDLIKRWVDAGAKAPDEAEPADPRQHWAFQKPVRPPVPTPRDPSWVRNPIDAFLGTDHDVHGLTPSAPADPAVLLRRVSLDLTGLLPTPAELSAFLADPSEEAYLRAVDRLLESPRYGERWGRHWMDVWRYSDWDGYGAEVRESQPHIWRWRDWIVESLNADKGYDRMIVEMLAADEAAPGDDSALRATGYLARNWYKFSRNVWLDNIIEHTSKAFLGLTMNCARCHDHKYDPIAQRDYYRLRAVFEPHEIRTDRLPGQPDTAKAGLVRVFDAKPEAATHLFRRGDEKDPDKDKSLAPGLPEVLGRLADIQAVSFDDEIAYPGLRAFLKEESLAQARSELTAAQEDVNKTKGKPDAALAEKSLAAARAGLTAVEARIAADAAKYAKPARPDADLIARMAAAAERQAAYLKAEAKLARVEADLAAAKQAVKEKPDDAKAKKRVVDVEKQLVGVRKASDDARAGLAKTDAAYTGLSPAYPKTSTGRRLSLARWMGSADNPLTARVAVNHIWMRHFGRGLVETPENFGLNGKPPTNPALLDWLACELMSKGWSLKAVHRLIVASNAYRMSSTPPSAGEAAANLAADPDNRRLWRMNARRMSAEEVRDNVLAVAGSLDPTMGGPDLDPASGEASSRRSLYFRHAKEKRMTFLKQFDSPSVTACYRRTESVIPQQALALVNSKLTLEQSRVLARAMASESETMFINAAFLRILGRAPSDVEHRECEEYLRDLARRLDGKTKSDESPAEHARASLVHVLYSHNDFVTVR